MLKKTKLCTGLMMAFGVLSTATAQNQQLERVTVTGSNIKRTDTETASPVQVITRQEIERSGKQSIQEVLRSVTADGQGSIPTSFTNGFASGSAAISLRGLGVNSTLVLINGRRMTTYGLADDGSRTFVDLNTIPLELVERVEVLKDGGSAVYGADAVGGVVNVILRKNYNGAAVGATYGSTSDSEGRTGRAYGTVGFGNLDTDKYNAFVSLEATKQNHIWSRDRGFLGASDLRPLDFYDTTNGAPRYWLGVTSPSTTSPFGVTRTPPAGSGPRVNVIGCDPSIVDPNTGLCRYNRTNETEIQPQIERLNLFGRGTMQVAPNLQTYLELGYFETKTKANGTLGGNNDSGVYNPADPANPIVHGLMTLPAGHPDNTFGVNRTLAYSPAELGGRDQTTKNQVFRAVAGLQGTTWGWDFDVGAAYIKSKLENTNTGYIRYSVMQDALNNGTYRINSPNTTSPDVLAAVSPPLVTEPTTSVKLLDIKVSRELMNLAGGPLGIALGAETRWEQSTNPAVPFTDIGDIVGLGYSKFDASRRVYAMFGELTAPVTKWLELSGALRYDHYSDFGSSTTPKVGFKVKPMDQFAIRGTYAEAFRAPGPAETGGTSFGFTSYNILSIGTPGIQPETAKSYTLGLIFEPMPGTSATVDFWRIKRKNEIVQADPASIIPASQCVVNCDGTAGTPDLRSATAGGAQANTFLYYDSEGNLATVAGPYTNANKTTTEGVDVELRHKMRLGEAGNLSGTLNWTHTKKFERTLASGETFEYAGTHGPIVLSSGAGTPKDRATASLTWDRGPYSISGAINYIGPIKFIDHKGETAQDNGDGTVTDPSNGLVYNSNGATDCSVYTLSGQPYGGCKLPSFTTFDLFGRWSPTKNLEFNVSIQNLFDRKAPFDPYLVNTYAINYNQTWHQSGAIGRYFTFGAKYTF
ncbi:MAG TPA: TonB-dependent receptor [Caldimonas sp.]|nr:TonB-dependent receptor [Caldimonas sp.]